MSDLLGGLATQHLGALKCEYTKSNDRVERILRSLFQFIVGELLQRLQMLADRVGQREGIKVDLAWVQIFETGKRTLGHEGEVTSAVSRMYGRAGLPKWMPRTSLIGT